ncbi:bacteriodes thetaiotaomicron symbiotic chitinase, partial [Apodospora peruviana]
MCGRDSDLGGTIKCGMNLCCAYSGWCGTTEGHCGNPDPNGLAPCQEGFGLCERVSAPTCNKAKSTDGRRIGYYQASNSRDRICNKVTPAQINTTGYTHLYFAFAAFSPITWEVVPASPDDVALFTEFTGLKKDGLETWIAIGGFDFSDPGTATHTAWSNMTASAAARKAFIASVMSFMDLYGFQGVDLDWEYPGAPERGGQRADTQNLVLLVKEMRAAFGTKYGISMAIAPDYWYLRWFDPSAMQDSVDWFGFMSYDLHGFWDADVKTLGSIVRGQTDIQEISNNTLPLWYDGLDPAKINFGVAYYGRGYTLSDPSCTDVGCPFAGPSKPAPCTGSAGVMSSREIQTLIKEKNLTPKLLEKSMMKQITWDGQWMGYDDDETIAMKKAWADGLCVGGTMAWSIDFSADNGAGSGDTPPETTDGSCGPTNGGAVCGSWATGSCCSSSGWCGSGEAYCGSGCQSGECIVGGTTTDGTCGALYSGTLCGDWAGGDCCSSSGWCGSSDAHCGTGCQSG